MTADERLEHVEGRLDEIVVKLDRISDDMRKAYPGGDADGHRRFHEMWIKDVEARRALIQAIKEKTIVNLVWMTIVGIGVAVGAYIVNFIRMGA